MTTEAITEQPVAETAPAVTKVKPPKVEKTGDMILDTVHEVENLSKTKALNLADTLVNDGNADNFKLGGVLKVLKDNSWFEGAENFDAFVLNRYGMKPRKAWYFISIYDNLATKEIPWEAVKDIGWTKLKELAASSQLTKENAVEWAEKCKTLTVVELLAILKQLEGTDAEKVKTTDPIVKITFKLKTDQADIVQQALSKARGELNTEFDTVALENIMAGYLGCNTAVTTAPTFEAMVESMGMMDALSKFADMFPTYDIQLISPEEKAAAAAKK